MAMGMRGQAVQQSAWGTLACRGGEGRREGAPSGPPAALLRARWHPGRVVGSMYRRSTSLVRCPRAYVSVHGARYGSAADDTP